MTEFDFMCKSAPLTFEDVRNCMHSHTPLSGRIIAADPHTQSFSVELDSAQFPMFGTLPFSDFSVQDSDFMADNTYLSKYARHQVGKAVVAYVTSCEPIKLSRIERQQHAMSFLKEGQPVLCKATHYSKFGVFVELDDQIGSGLTALCPHSNLSLVRYSDISKWISIGETFPAIIKSISQDGKINVSRKEYYQISSSYENYSVDQIILCKVGPALSDGIGYFVEVNPGITGILDLPNLDLKLYEGMYISAVITKKRLLAGNNVVGLCMRLISILE